MEEEALLDIVKILIGSRTLLKKCDIFATRLGLQLNEREELLNSFRNGMSYEELFKAIVEKALDSDDDENIVERIQTALVKMDLKGVAGKLPGWNKDEQISKDSLSKKANPKDSKKPRNSIQDRVDMFMDTEPLIVKVKQATRLRYFSPKEGYSLKSEPRGFALIINNINFPGEKRRDGADKDKMYMSQLLTQMGFLCSYKEDVMSEEELQGHIKNFQQQFKDSCIDACIVVVMSHGENGQIFMLDGNPVNLWKKIVYKFNNNDEAVPQRLKEIPKIFIFQACQDWRTADDSVKEEMKVPNVSDAVVIFPSIPGDSARRDLYKGSWFIYCLTKVFMEHAHDTDLETMLKKVQSGVLPGIISDSDCVQVCYWTTFIFKKLYFNPKTLSI